MDSLRKSRSVKKGLARRARERGKLSGGQRAYGYRWEGPNQEKDLVQVPVETEVVLHRIFEAYDSGMSQTEVTQALNNDRIPTVKGGPWTQAAVGRILANELYMGKIRSGGKLYDGAHEPIVSTELWERVRARREAATRTRGRYGGRPALGHHLLVGGVLRCKCGYALLPRTDQNRGPRGYEAYTCDGRRRFGIEFCDQTRSGARRSTAPSGRNCAPATSRSRRPASG